MMAKTESDQQRRSQALRPYAALKFEGDVVHLKSSREIDWTLDEVLPGIKPNMRSILNKQLKDGDRLQEIISLLDVEGIQPTPDSQPLLAVNKSQVRLVTWMAVSKG